MGRRNKLRLLARKVLGEEKAKKVWSRIEIIGDIAIIRKPFEMEISDLQNLGEILLKELPYVKSVWCTLSEVKGEYRLRDFIHLAGKRKSETVYVEHKCKFKLDITKVYVSPTLSYEHGRIAELVKPGEVIVNMFAGAGLFSIIIARKVRPVKVYSIDVNPYAYKYMIENIKLNKVENYVLPMLGDAGEVISEKLANVANRVLMPLPELAIPYLKYALLALKDKGFLHVYLFIKAHNRKEALEEACNVYSRELEKHVVYFKNTFSRVVRSVGPRRYQVVLDYLIVKS